MTKSSMLCGRTLLILTLLVSARLICAQEYHVIRICTAAAADARACAHLDHCCERLNGLHHEFPTAVPYYSVVTVAGGERWLVFGWRDEVAGLIRDEFPTTLQNLIEAEEQGQRCFPDACWINVAELRACLLADVASDVGNDGEPAPQVTTGDGAPR